MSSEIGAFEVEVEVNSGSQHYGYYPVYAGAKAIKGAFIKDAIVKMFQFEHCTKQRAIELAKRHGKVKSCRKIDAYESLLSIEHLELNQKTVYDNGIVNAVNVGEMPWKRKMQKQNFKKDKKYIDDVES